MSYAWLKLCQVWKEPGSTSFSIELPEVYCELHCCLNVFKCSVSNILSIFLRAWASGGLHAWQWYPQYNRNLRALPFLPTVKTQWRFNWLQQQAMTEGLEKFTNFVADNWVTAHTFPPATWSMHMETVRTNNDLKGWHNSLNWHIKGKSNLPLYVLIQLLHKEAALVLLQIRLMSERRLLSHQRKMYKKRKKLLSLWQQYEEGKKNSTQLLEACSHLVNLV